MYIVSTGLQRECFTDYAIKSLDAVNDLLLDEGFLLDYSWMFDDYMTGFRLRESSNVNLPIELYVQYWSDDTYKETIFYLNKVKLLGEQL